MILRTRWCTDLYNVHGPVLILGLNNIEILVIVTISNNHKPTTSKTLKSPYVYGSLRISRNRYALLAYDIFQYE